jgi:hypothetical protein
VSPIATTCLRHKRILPLGERCPECVTDKAERRRRFEPWQPRGFYSHYRWREARKRVLERDGFTCSFAGCAETHGIEIHHWPVPVSQLWQEAGGDWDMFLAIATDETNLVSSCRSHHRRSDAARRAIAGSRWAAQDGRALS